MIQNSTGGLELASLALGIFELTTNERRVIKVLRDEALLAIKDRDEAKIAPMLGLMPAGLKALCNRKYWDFTTAFRVADILELPIGKIIESASS